MPVPLHCGLCPPHPACFTGAALVALSPFLPKSLANLGSQERLVQSHSQALRLPLSPGLPTPQATAGQRAKRQEGCEAWAHGPDRHVGQRKECPGDNSGSGTPSLRHRSSLGCARGFKVVCKRSDKECSLSCVCFHLHPAGTRDTGFPRMAAYNIF